eukprot:scaffold151676_cov33-Attheya_sp.AAC.1
MMLAFCDGSLCEAIRRAIMSNRLIVQNFFDLCDEVVDMPLDESGHQKIDQGDAVMKNGATRTRVAAAAACSKAKGTAGKENEQE